MDNSLITPALLAYPLRYQLIESFKSALLDGDTPRALALVEQLQATQHNLGLLTVPWDGDRTALMLALDPEMHPNSPLDLAVVRALLAAGAPVNAWTPARPGPLLFAILSGSLPAAEALLAGGAEVNQAHGEWIWHAGDTKSMLVRAIEAKQSAIALRLLDAGADALVAQALLERGVEVNAQFPDADKPNSYGSGPSYAPSDTALMEAAATENNPVLPLLIKAGAEVNARSDKAETALHRATAEIYWQPEPGPENARLLLEAGADANAREQVMNSTPLLNALGGLIPFNGGVRRHIVHQFLPVLLQHGADADDKAQSDRGRTPLAMAILRRDLRSVLILLRGGATLQGMVATNLWLLAGEGDSDQHRELAEILRAHGLEPNARQQNNALRDAVMEGVIERVRLLLDNGADPDGVPAHSDKPLHLAAERGQIEIVNELLQRGADPNIRRQDLCTPLQRAAAGKARDSAHDAAILGERHARHSAERQRRGDSYHEEYLRLTHLDVKANSIKRAENSLQTVRALLVAGADVNARNHHDGVPLHTAVRKATPAVVALLLEAGAQVNATDTDKRTPLHRLLLDGRRWNLTQENERGLSWILFPPHTLDEQTTRTFGGERERFEWAAAADAEILQLLLAHGAAVNQRGYNDYPPLHLACIYGAPASVQTLLEAGAEINATLHNRTAIDFIFSRGRTGKLLEKIGFARHDFPAIFDELQTFMHEPERDLQTLFPDGTLALRIAAHEDVTIGRLLLSADILYGAEIQS